MSLLQGLLIPTGRWSRSGPGRPWPGCWKRPRFGLEKVLLEPHLVRRLGLSSPLLRFQGCRAARHDDHLHLQITP